MPPTRILILLGVAAMFPGLPGCETVPGNSPPKSTITLVLRPAERKVLSALTIGSAIRIVLPPPSQGSPYAWEILSNNIRILRQSSPIRAETDASGRATSYSVVFQAKHVSPPRSIVTIAAVRPGVTESEPSDIYQVSVGVEPEPRT